MSFDPCPTDPHEPLLGHVYVDSRRRWPLFLLVTDVDLASDRTCLEDWGPEFCATHVDVVVLPTGPVGPRDAHGWASDRDLLDHAPAACASYRMFAADREPDNRHVGAWSAWWTLPNRHLGNVAPKDSPAAAVVELVSQLASNSDEAGDA